MKRTRNLNDDAFDERGLLKDQRSYRVPMRMMDAASVDSDKPSRRPLITDGSNNPMGLHRPGFRIAQQDAGAPLIRRVVTDTQRQAVADARQRYDDELTSAWRGKDAADDPIVGAGEHNSAGAKAVGEPEGAQCTVKNGKYAKYFGSPGVIRGGVCVPKELDKSDDDESKATSDSKRKKWQGRDPKGRETGSWESEDDDDDDDKADDIVKATSDSIDQKIKDHEQTMDALYAARDRELEAAWRTGK